MRAAIAACAGGAAVVVVGFQPASGDDYGRLVTGDDGALTGIVEAKDATAAQLEIGLCNSGVMAVSGEHLFGLLDGLDTDNAKREYYLTDIWVETSRVSATWPLNSARNDWRCSRR